jgi:hypothetical protein
MTLPKNFRPLAAAMLALGLFLALPGCGGGDTKPTPDNKGDKKDDKKDSKDPGTTVAPKISIDPPLPKPPEKLDFNTGVGKEAMDFLGSVRNGPVRAGPLSTGFLKTVGKPVVFDADKTKGYSESAAEGWLKKVGESTGFAPALYSKQAGEFAVLKGGLAGKQGSYALRMVLEGGAWKVDWLSASSVLVPGAVAVSVNDSEAMAREFAATAVFEAICDKDALGLPERVAVIAGGLTPALRAAWADPFAGDKEKGYDYSPKKLEQKIEEIGKGAESLSFTAQGDAFKVEVAKTGGEKATYILKLTKGTTPGQWLVSGIDRP